MALFGKKNISKSVEKNDSVIQGVQGDTSNEEAGFRTSNLIARSSDHAPTGRRIYLIDYENVHDDGLDGFGLLTEMDTVYFFYSMQIKNIPFDRHVEMMTSKAGVEFIKTGKTAKNYLDFQLTTYLGYLLGKGEQGEIFIISKDHGFDSTVDFWLERGYIISRQETIEGHAIVAKKKVTKKAATVKTEGGRSADSKETTDKSAGAKKMSGKTSGGSRSGEKASGRKKPDAKASAESTSTKKASAEKTSVERASAEKVSAEKLSAEKISAEKTMGGETSVEASLAGEKLRRKNSRKKNPNEKDSDNTSQDHTGFGDVNSNDVNSNDVNSNNVNSNGNEVVRSDNGGSAESASAAAVNRKRISKTIPISELEEAKRKEIRNAVKSENLVASAYTTIYRIFINSKDKQAFNNELVQAFGQEKANKIYGSLKKLYSSYHLEK